MFSNCANSVSSLDIIGGAGETLGGFSIDGCAAGGDDDELFGELRSVTTPLVSTAAIAKSNIKTPPIAHLTRPRVNRRRLPKTAACLGGRVRPVLGLLLRRMRINLTALFAAGPFGFLGGLCLAGMASYQSVPSQYIFPGCPYHLSVATSEQLWWASPQVGVHHWIHVSHGDPTKWSRS